MRAVAARRRLNAFCPTHAVRFPISGEDGAIQCDAAPHLLAENYPFSTSGGRFLELCTACDTVWPFSSNLPASHCLHCATAFGQRTLCAACSVFTLGPAATAALRCAGCGAARTAEQLHSCPEVGMFSSAREECPFCAEPIAPVPHAVEAPRAESVPRPKPVPRGVPNIGFEAPVPPPAVVAPSRPSRSKPLLALAALAIVLALIAVSSIDTFPRKVERALAARRYFPPAESSVYDIYTAEAQANPGSPAVTAAAQKIVAQLGAEADQHLQTFYRDSRVDLGWPELERYYGFLSTLAPDDAGYKAKHAYAEGQRRLLDERNHRAAFDCYRRALSHDSRFVLALNGIAKLYIQESSPFHDEEEGRRRYEEAAAADPNFTWALKNLGEYYMQREEWSRADDYMRRALQTSPSRPSILSALGRISYRRNRPREALEYYQRAVQHASNADDIRRYNASIAQIREELR